MDHNRIIEIGKRASTPIAVNDRWLVNEVEVLQGISHELIQEMIRLRVLLRYRMTHEEFRKEVNCE